VDEVELEARVWAAMSECRSLRRDEPAWRGYWREVVRRSVGADDVRVLDTLYEHYAHPAAWRVGPGARACLDALARARIGLGVISNWDTRLGKLLERLGLGETFDVVVVSGEVGFEKPDPRVFHIACERLGVEPSRLLHVGDREDDDVEGARAAGCRSLWYGRDVRDFDELRTSILGG
jgi:REG-2-like HAD superfamily hydrolase